MTAAVGCTLRVLGVPGAAPGEEVTAVLQRILGAPAQGVWTVQLLWPGRTCAQLECWGAQSRGEALAARAALAPGLDHPVAWPDKPMGNLV